jgi:glycerol-3-phosphate O-acyltransferase/dihydroxyacetone phosphate acyltransferase
LAGLIILTPLGILNSFLAEKARKEALAGSSVKVVGVDVMATKKLTTTMMIYPFLAMGFTLFFYYILGKLYYFFH